ncbi:DMT family transporter [Mangrovicella endophytica]|uniref:DMT family transporter n=1 Tax=Mangrovicella endophytica TaxID=2066697 RepID=UPI000C9E8428|nr:DMT family transporter [Mangrovicella endophytica]
MRRTFSHPYVALALTALFWGGNSVAGKLSVPHISPMILTLLRWGLAAALLTPFAWPHLKRDWPAIRPRLPVLLLLGAIGFSGFNGVMYVALHYTSAINSMLEQASMPLFVFLGSFLLFGARASGFQIAGFLITALGVAITASHGNLASLVALDLNRGDAIMMIAVVLYAAYTLGLRYKPKIHWLSAAAALSYGAFAAAIPMALAEHAMGLSRWPDGFGIAVVVYTAVFASIIAQSFYIYGVEAIGANRANIFVNLIPVFGAVLAVSAGEVLYLYHVLALGLVLVGIWLAERRQVKIETAPRVNEAPSQEKRAG